MIQVTDNTKEKAKELIHKVDQKLSEVTCNTVTKELMRDPLC